MMIRKLVLLSASLTLAGSVAGCVSLLPKAKPSQLYRFGVSEAQAPAQPSSGPRYNISRAGTDFNRASGGDRILTVTGAEAAYVAQSRWVSPAAILFEDAASRAFDASPGCARFLSRGDPAPAEAVMRMEVRTFEIRYLDGPQAPPTAVVDAQVTLTRGRDRQVILERTVQAQERASENRVSAMVFALDAATGKVLNEIAAAANAEAANQGCGSGAASATRAATPARTTTTTTTTTRPR